VFPLLITDRGPHGGFYNGRNMKFFFELNEIERKYSFKQWLEVLFIMVTRPIYFYSYVKRRNKPQITAKDDMARYIDTIEKARKEEVRKF